MSADALARARARLALGRTAAGTFLGELRRRHVTRVAVTYLAVGWIVVQASSALVPALGIPGWILSLVTLLTILGFPLAMVLAWAVEITPEGLRFTDPALPTARAHPVPTAAPSLRAIAALPFADRSPDGGFQFLGDGITEELISALARTDGIQVVGRSSAFAFRDEATDVREVGRRLGVGAVVEGSLRVSGSRLRVTAQLVDAGTGYALWSTTRNGTLEDIMVFQEEIALAIAGALGAHLFPEARPDDPSSPPSVHQMSSAAGPSLHASTRDVEAYQLYLKGRVHWNERTASSLATALRYFRRATKRDPSYARAHAGEADALALRMEYGLLSPQEGLEPARAAVERALRWGAALPESHVAAGLVHQVGWQWSDAEAAFRTALSLDPGHSTAHHRLALLLAWRGEEKEGWSEWKEARRLDPLAPGVAATEGWLRYYQGDGRGAVDAHRRVLEDHPELDAARMGLALALLGEDLTAEAVEALTFGREAGAGDPAHTALLALALARAGRRHEARHLVRILDRRATEGYVSPFHRALPLLALDGSEAALAELENAAAAQAPQLAYLAVDPVFDPLRSLSRFQRLVEATGLRRSGSGTGVGAQVGSWDGKPRQ
jgi:TolB-like protein/tetratricopeptide (TPR) repeat protein